MQEDNVKNKKIRAQAYMNITTTSLLSRLWNSQDAMSMFCGIDDSPVEHVNEGVAKIETYPWLGVLYYPYNQKRLTTAVVLVTRQMVVATALEIDKLPKQDFRTRARVIIGHNCTVGPGVGIRDYSYHPDYTRNTYSAMALIQLETDHVTMKLQPICPPPDVLHFQNQSFFAMVLSKDCYESKMTIHKMMFVSTEDCQSYYRRAQLDVKTIWPTYTACAKSVAGGECVWRSGAILVVKVGNRWHLLGFGVYGPGCQAPARFLDYGMYHEWVRRSVARIGRPAITKLAPNYVVLRRSLSNIQRFGLCDGGELASELYTESAQIDGVRDGRYYLNLSIISDVEYSCIVLRAEYMNRNARITPSLRLRRYCGGARHSQFCYSGMQFVQILFSVEITFQDRLRYSVQAYGRTITATDSFQAHKYANKNSNLIRRLFSYKQNKMLFKKFLKNKKYKLYVFCGVYSLSCGIDDSPRKHVSEGVARIETYPWLGVLYYPYQNKKWTTAVVLVTRQMVVAAALEIDKLPKEDFRARARVVIGHNCTAKKGVGIRDYSYHPDYTRNTYSAMALIQLETDHVTIELRPICPPPRAVHYQNKHFYAMVLSNDCEDSLMTIHKMMLVSSEDCKTYYRRTQLDIDSIWPTYTACAKSVAGGECVWRSGAILVVKAGTRWSLLGFGVYGPGCQAPARFLDYGMYHDWVRRSVARIGRPAITKLAANHVVLRRTLSNIQRFGPCDHEEVDSELYSELVDIRRTRQGKYYLNLTIISDVEYSCVILRADYKDNIKEKTPKIRLRRYCAGPGPTALCFTGVQNIQIQFYVEISFDFSLKYSIQAYGKAVTAMDPFRAHKYANKKTTLWPIAGNHKWSKLEFKQYVTDPKYPLYGKKQMKSRDVTGNSTDNNSTTTKKPK
ncbi:hypothetical protein PYW08_009945 [Mythimna loreyi]|uniref:Uncharacterized protein n=1 Tax=Mythimna loreyi TaxID=667449 RepID=A0ACC2QA06_9NEOP|nr:hypothetical protein PYW08_009945 [Mythimna loreyi]